MSSDLTTSDLLIAGCDSARPYPGLGVLGSDIPSTGDSGPSPLYNDSVIAGNEYAWFVETPPSSGALTLYADGSFEYAAVADGVYYFAYRLYDNGVDAGTATVTLQVGTVSAPGATLVGTSGIAAGAAFGVSDTAAAGANMAGVGTLSTGNATADSSGAGATLSGIGAVSAGSATGESTADAVVSGVDLSGVSVGFFGGVYATASATGVILAGASSASFGAAAAVSSDGIALGAHLTGQSSTVAGAAVGDKTTPRSLAKTRLKVRDYSAFTLALSTTSSSLVLEDQ